MPAAMAVAALPMAATHTGVAGEAATGGPASSASRTQRRPFTRARPVWNSSSSSSRRGSSAPADHFELATSVAPGQFGRVRALELQPIEVSSSLVRQLVARGRGIEELVGAEVAAYVAEQGLYRRSARTVA